LRITCCKQVHNQGKEAVAVPLIKDVKLPATKMQNRVQVAAWVLIYSGLLTLITGYTLGQMGSASSVPGWHTAHTLMLAGGLATALGALLIYIRSRMS
jgi:DMSO reductase anchor subunit